MQYPKISIVTPSFNQGQYIEQTILSIINQGYPNLEYIIIDGGSTDNTVEIIKKYEKYLTYWVSEPDRGQSHAINKGLEKCTGDIFNWINSDDYLEDGALDLIEKAFIENNDVLQVCGFTRLFEEETGETIMHHRCELFENTEMTIVEQRINQPGAFYNLQTIKELRGVNETLHYVMDLELWLRFLTKFGQQRIKLINTTIAHFRVHSNSKTSTFEEKFKRESNGLFYHLLLQLKSPVCFIDYFEKNHDYIPFNWDMNGVQKKLINLAVARYYFFHFYHKKSLKACRIAIIYLIYFKKVKFNWNFCRIFLKSFFGF